MPAIGSLLDSKYPNAPAEWRWQCVFLQENHWRNAKTGEPVSAVDGAALVASCQCHAVDGDPATDF
jgi:hypothetical protein